MVARTRLNATLHAHGLYCYKVNLFCTSLCPKLHVALLWYCQCSADSFTPGDRYQVCEILVYGGGFLGWHIADVILQ